MTALVARSATVLPFAILPGVAIGLIVRGSATGWWSAILIILAVLDVIAFVIFWREGAFDD